MGFDPRNNYGGGGGKAVVAEGPHLVYVTAAEKRVSKTGNPMIKCTFTVIDKQDHDEGKEIDEYIVLVETPWGFGKLARLCRSIDPDMPDADSGGLDPESQKSINDLLLGQPLALTVQHEHEQWRGRDGKQRQGVKSRVDRFRGEGLTDAEKDRLLASYSEGGEQFLTPPLPGDGADDEGPVPPDDDIPF